MKRTIAATVFCAVLATAGPEGLDAAAKPAGSSGLSAPSPQAATPVVKPASVKPAEKAAVRSKVRTVDRVGLVVNHEAATMGEIEEAIASYYLGEGRRPPASLAGAEYQKVRRKVLDAMIEEFVLSQEAAPMSIEVSDKEAEKQAEAEIEAIRRRFDSPKDFEQGLAGEGLTEEQFRDDLALKMKRQIQAARVLKAKQQEMPSSLLTDDNEVKKAYEGHERDYDQVKFSAIVFRIPPEKKGGAEYRGTLVRQAEEMMTELKGGADFAAYARKYSEEPSTADKGGDIGTRFRYELTPALARGVFGVPVKGFGVVSTDEAVYLVRVSYRKNSTFESAAPEIRERLRRDSTGKAMSKWLQDLKSRAYIRELK